MASIMSKKAKIFNKGNRVRGSGKEPDGEGDCSLTLLQCTAISLMKIVFLLFLTSLNQEQILQDKASWLC